MRDYKFILLIFLALSGCDFLSSDSENETLVEIEAVQDSFSLAEDEIIGLKVTNVSSDRIYYSTCNSGSIQELDGSRVNRSVIFVNPCECICTFSMEEGEQEEVEIESYLIRDHDELQFTSNVTYKVFPHFYFDENLERRISSNSVHMSPITITRE